MVTEIIMPKLGQTMEDGTIIEWLKTEGDSVERGELLFTTESDKATLEVEAPRRGFLRRILVPAGETVPVLSVVGLITRAADDDLSQYESGEQPAPASEAPTPVIAQEPSVSTPTGPSLQAVTRDRIFSSPRARKLAQEKGVDLGLLVGTGPSGRIKEGDVIAYLETQPKITPVARKAAEALGVDIATVAGTGASGRITRADIESAVASPEMEQIRPVEDSVVERVPLAGPRRIVAERMAASSQSTARVTLVTEVDAALFVDAREQLKASVTDEWGFVPAYNDLLALIVARALHDFPYMNARLSADGTAIERLSQVNVGLAVDTERGLLVPVVRNADQKGLRVLGSEFRALTERARTGKALPDDLSGGTFTITNLGMHEIDVFTPIINLPEAAILGVGRIQTKPIVSDGAIVARPMMTLSLAFDHRLVDGAPAARFLQRIKQLVENPFLLLG